MASKTTDAINTENIETTDAIIDAEIVSDNAGTSGKVVSVALNPDEVDDKRAQYSFTPGRGQKIVTTLPLTTRQEMMRVVGLSQTAESLEDHIGEILTVNGLIVQPGEATTTDGETRRVWWVTFLTTDGKAITTGSSTVAKSLETMNRPFGGWESLFSEPFDIVAEKRRTNNKREFTDIHFHV